MVRLASVVLALAASVAFAADPLPATKPAAESSDDGLAEAKREFQAVKSARSAPAQQSTLELPRLATPELQIGASPAPAVVRPPTAAEDKKSTANWLVDGVMGKPAQETDEKTSFGRAQQPKDRDAISADGRQNRGKDDDAAADNAKDAKRSEAEPNPLTRYMAGWMTKGDYALLRPGLSGEMASDFGGRADTPFTGVSNNGVLLSSTGADATFGLNGNATPTAPSFATPPARENPFLPPIEASPVKSMPSSPATDLMAKPASPVALPVEAPSTKSNIPDFAKPNDDAKYFKQLKRF